jgi:hypothetical protein
MNLPVKEAANLLGAELSYVREEVFESALLGTMRSLIFESKWNRVLSVTPCEHATVFILSDEGRTLEAHFLRVSRRRARRSSPPTWKQNRCSLARCAAVAYQISLLTGMATNSPFEKTPNKAPEPTTTAVTPRAT